MQRVLIDTWWNVNIIYILFLRTCRRVLIDTWWNVNNTLENELEQRIDGFNRYMVECEFWMMHLCSRDSCVLIDTWWNVNSAYCDQI